MAKLTKKKKETLQAAIEDLNKGMKALEYILVTLTDSEPPKKPKKKQEEVEEDVQLDDGPDLIEEDADDLDDFDLGDDEDIEEEKPKFTLKEVQEEFKKFVAKFKDTKKGRLTAKKVCKKFGAESTKDLDPGDFEEIVKVLRTKK